MHFFCAVEMERGVLTEQRTNIKCLMKLGKSEWEILEMQGISGFLVFIHRAVFDGTLCFRNWICLRR
jgi:DNA-binding CsgD family transcriptional regulator